MLTTNQITKLATQLAKSYAKTANGPRQQAGRERTETNIEIKIAKLLEGDLRDTDGKLIRDASGWTVVELNMGLVRSAALKS